MPPSGFMMTASVNEEIQMYVSGHERPFVEASQSWRAGGSFYASVRRGLTNEVSYLYQEALSRRFRLSF
jgi:hypothetical protein